MTARRKVALRKAQLASAKKRRRRNAAIGVGVVAAVGYGGYKASYINLYHNTSHHRARMITKHGFQPLSNRSAVVKYGQGSPVLGKIAQNTYMTTRKNGVARMYGPDTVKVRIRRTQLRKVAYMGHYQPGGQDPSSFKLYARKERYIAVPTSQLVGRKVKHVRTVTQRDLRRVGPYPLW
jgi:hypothetical protein